MRPVTASRHQRLLVAEQAAVGRMKPGLRELPGRLHRIGEVGEEHRGARPEPGPRLHAHPRLGDHAQRAFGAAEQPLRRRARTGGRQPPGLQHAARRHHADGLHELVDMGVQRREVAARARRYPPAQRRPFERLREMPQRQAERLQLRLQRRAQRARRDPRGPRGTVDFQHPLQVAKVDADRAGIAVTHIGLDPADHAGATAERDRRRAGLAAPVQHRHQLVLAAREGHEIGRVRVIPAEGPHQVTEGPAVRVGSPVVRVRAEDRPERRRRHQPRRGQVQLLHPGRLLHAHAVDPQARGENGPELLDLARREPLVLQAPAPELAPPGGRRWRRGRPVACSDSAHYRALLAAPPGTLPARPQVATSALRSIPLTGLPPQGRRGVMRCARRRCQRESVRSPPRRRARVSRTGWRRRRRPGRGSCR